MAQARDKDKKNITNHTLHALLQRNLLKEEE